MRLNPLRNPGTSKVFYTLIEGTSTPSQLAARLGIKPPAVTEQLRRLERVGVVRLDQKRGKFRQYLVDWDKVVETTANGVYADEKTLELREFFKRNEVFRRIVVGYFRRVAHDALMTCMPFEEVLDDFSADLPWSYPRLKRGSKRREAREFLKALKRWRELAGEMRIVTLDALMDSLEEEGLL